MSLHLLFLSSSNSLLVVYRHTIDFKKMTVYFVNLIIFICPGIFYRFLGLSNIYSCHLRTKTVLLLFLFMLFIFFFPSLIGQDSRTVSNKSVKGRYLHFVSQEGKCSVFCHEWNLVVGFSQMPCVLVSQRKLCGDITTWVAENKNVIISKLWKL